MNKFVILVACMVSLVAAGVLDDRSILGRMDLDDTRMDTDRITRLTKDELLRQKFLLDILQHVQQPLVDVDLLKLGNSLVVDADKYIEKIDDEMLEIIELCRSQRLLGKHEIFTITDDLHMRQMIGLYRMLVRSRDWQTFQRNACFARIHMNGALLVNSLLLAIRDREDTQMLIVPAIHEILPELYFDEELVRKAQSIDMSLLTTDTDTTKPGLLDMIGLGRRTKLMNHNLGTGMGMLDRTQLWMPWREMRMEMGIRKSTGEKTRIMVRNENKIVLPVERRLLGDSRMTLLTEDVGLKSFLHGMINDLCLREDELLHSDRNIDEERLLDRSGLMLERERLNIEDDRRMRMDDLGMRGDLDSNDRLLRVGRRRLQMDIDDDMMEDRSDRLMQRERISGGRRVVSNDRKLQHGDIVMDRTMRIDDLPTSNINSGRLLHINRRRMQTDDITDSLDQRRGLTLGNGRERFMNIMQRNKILDGRRTDDVDGRRLSMGLDRSRRLLIDEDVIDRQRMMDIDGDMSLRRNRMDILERKRNLLDRRMDREDIDRKTLDMDLPTTNINNDRLLHVNRRHLDLEDMQDDNGQMMSRLHSIDDGRKISQLQRERDIDLMDRNRRLGLLDGENRDVEGKRMLDEREIGIRRSTIDNKRLLHVNRRHLIDDDDMDTLEGTQGQLFMDMVHRGIRDGRRILERDDEDIRMKDRQMGLRRSSIENERLLKLNRRRLNVDDDVEESMRGLLHGDDDRERLMGRRIVNDDDKERLMGRRIVNDDDEDRWMGRRRIDDDDEMLREHRRIKYSVRSNDDIGMERVELLGMQTFPKRRDERLMNRRSMDTGGDRLLVTGRRRRVDLDDDVTDRNSEVRHRLPRSLRSADMMNSDRVILGKLRGGELLLHNLQQLLARINLERISLGMTDMMDDSMRLNNPRLVEAAGERLALRLNEMRLDTRRNRLMLEKINEIEKRLSMVIELEVRRIIGVDRDIRDQTVINRIIGDVLLGKVEGVGILHILREILLQTEDIHGMQTLTHLGVALHDPIMHHLLRRIIKIVDLQRQQMGSYRREDLLLEGVTINDVIVDKLRTYVDVSDADLINLIDSRLTLSKERMQKMLVARQQRLNHKSFNINLDLTSDRNQRVVIRTLLGPKIDALGQEVQLDEQRLNFMLLDAIVTDLHTGRNTIVRKSRDITWTARDTTLYTEIYQRVMMAIKGDLDMTMDRVIGQNCRFPHRLLLPRGRVEGLPMQLLVIVTPVEDSDRTLQRTIRDDMLCGMGIGSMNLDRLPLGFPLDRRIDDIQQLLSLSNLHLKDVTIHHDDKLKMDIL